MNMLTSRTLTLALGALTLAASASAVTRVGNPYRPSGANFQITSRQGIDSSTSLGVQDGSQVNLNFEFNPSIGVTWADNGHLTDFGVGLYKDSLHNEHSTGLMVTYDQVSDAYRSSAVVEDFDIHTGQPFNPNKVEPSMILFGANGSQIAIGPDAMLRGMTERDHSDIWDVNFGQVLSGAGIADTAITGFLLYADNTRNEKVPSDPYLVVSIGNGTAVPEPTTLCGLGLGAIAIIRKRKARK